MLRRSQFHKTSVQQLGMAADDPRGHNSQAWTRDMRGMLSRHARVAVPSLIIEDMIGTMKGTKTSKRGNKYGRPQRGMGMVIRRGVVDKRHRFLAPASDLPIGGKSACIAKSAFAPLVENRSLPWAEIATTKQAPPYYSPKGEMFSHSMADMDMLDCVLRAGDINKLGSAWVGECAHVDHRLLLGVPSGLGPMPDIHWFHALYQWPQSAVLVLQGIVG